VSKPREPSRSLVPVEDVTGGEKLSDWLETVRCRLRLRSHCAMHRAISAQTGLKYDTVHKALTPSTGAKRLRGEIVECLQSWLREAASGEALDIPDELRGEPAENLHGSMPALLKLMGTKQAVYERVGRETGIRPGTIRRYFQQCGPVKTAPLVVVRCVRELQALAEEGAPAAHASPPRGRRGQTNALARLATEALREWRRSGGCPEMESRYRALRRDLIADCHARLQVAAGA